MEVALLADIGPVVNWLLTPHLGTPDMSPLMRLILKMMRSGVLGAAALLAVFMAIAAWQRWIAGNPVNLTGQDISFFVVMGLLLAGALLFARAIGRELDEGDGS